VLLPPPPPLTPPPTHTSQANRRPHLSSLVILCRRPPSTTSRRMRRCWSLPYAAHGSRPLVDIYQPDKLVSRLGRQRLVYGKRRSHKMTRHYSTLPPPQRPPGGAVRRTDMISRTLYSIKPSPLLFRPTIRFSPLPTRSL